MNRCQTCTLYSAIDPSVGNCRLAGASRQQIVAAVPTGTCSAHRPVANDNPSRVAAA